METYKSQPNLRPRKKAFKITNLRGEEEKPKKKFMTTQEYIERKKKAKNYLKSMKKQYHLDEKYNDFNKLTSGLKNDRKLVEIEKLENKAKMKENLMRAKRGPAGGKLKKMGKPPKPEKKEPPQGEDVNGDGKVDEIDQLEKELEEEEDID